MSATEQDKADQAKAEKAEPMDRDSTPEVTFEVDPEIVPPLPAKKEPAPEPMKLTENLPPRAWPPKVISDLMTRKLITMREDEPLGDLETWMDRFRFRHLPIVDEGGKLVGLITRTDFLHASLGKGPDGGSIDKPTAETHASAIMRKGVVTARPDEDLITALRVVLAEKLTSIPVILADGTLVGLVTETDFARLTLEILERAQKGA